MNASSTQMLRAVLWALFGWSVAVWLLAQAGLGGRYSLHPSDPEGVAPLPELSLARAQSQLGPLPEYAAVADRPLFNPDRRPLPPADAPATEQAPAPAPAAALDVVLSSVVIAGKTKIAIVTDRSSGKSQSLKVGDSLAGDQSGWKLVELQPRAAVFQGPSGRSRADLRVFDGVGGQAPTPVELKIDATESDDGEAAAEAEQTPESRAEMIRKRIEERRRQMREEAARANQERGQ